ncbi:prephenate dehydratase [Friedmanniomyces endolithicus]|nr:prephenate dehydratase [Friedmanniomyces endolithicus]KAK0798992.1 prephenate dehydratase [Friedmanniomyces endolithicus]KAK0803560.1 prephenate dehydratase [Friedmanniomyces endolithicus]
MAGKEEVAFLGPIASYTHQAALTHFPSPHYTVVPQTTIADVFAAVQSGSVSQGVVPFENSSNGSVIFTLDLFADLAGRNPEILVCGEVYLGVHHCLLGHSAAPEGQDRTDRTTAEDVSGVSSPKKSRAKPLRDLKHITKLYSHHQAWGQCNDFLTTHLNGIERIDVSSTSKAAEIVRQDDSGCSAAISSRMAGELNGLEFLAENLEDNEGNSTRFLVLRRRDDRISRPDESAGEADGEAETDDEHARYKTLVSFTVRHNEPGDLAGCLAVFQKYGLNLTSINSRPSNEATWHYIFFVEIMGRKRHVGSGAVNQALKGLDGVAQSWRWLGSWENALKA